MTFEEYAAARLDPLFRFASVLTGDRGLAEDVVQDVLIKLHERWEQLQSVGNLDAYVRRMIVNGYISSRRRWGRLIPTQHDRLPDVGQPDFAGEHAERDRLVGQLAALPRQQRAAVVLRFYEGMTYDEAADVLGCTPSTARGHVSKALSALRISFADEPALDPIGKDLP